MGSFVLTGETKPEVISVVIRRVFRRVQSALLHVWELTLDRENCQTENPAVKLTTAAIMLAVVPFMDHLLASLPAYQRSHGTDLFGHPRSQTELGMKDIGSFLNTLQCTTQVVNEDLRT